MAAKKAGSTKVDLPDGYSAEFPSNTPKSQIIIPVRLSVDSRLDLGKKVFLDHPFYGDGRPADSVMDMLLMKVVESRMTEAEFLQLQTTLRVIELEREVKELKRTNGVLQTELDSAKKNPEFAIFDRHQKDPFPWMSSDKCLGHCSRGGDGPACGKQGCKG